MSELKSSEAHSKSCRVRTPGLSCWYEFLARRWGVLGLDSISPPNDGCNRARRLGQTTPNLSFSDPPNADEECRSGDEDSGRSPEADGVSINRRIEERRLVEGVGLLLVVGNWLIGTLVMAVVGEELVSSARCLPLPGVDLRTSWRVPQ
jgi:hypothetical protein